MVGARRAIASRVGAAVVGGARDASKRPSSDRGQPRATQARDDCNKSKKNIAKTIIRIT